MNRDKLFFRHVLLHYFDLKKTAAETYRIFLFEYGEDQIPSETTCRVWFQRFRNGDFDLKDKEHPGQQRKFDNGELQELLDGNPTQSLTELSKALNASPMVVSKRLQAIGKIHKEGKWLSHKLSEDAILNRLSIATSLLARQRKKSFLWRIVTGDEKWIYFDNPKRRKTSVEQPSTSTPKSNIYENKALLYIWWDQSGVLYHELLHPNETVTADRYQKQLCRLSDALMQKRPSMANNRRKVIFLQDNARLHIVKSVKQTLLDLEWEILPHPACSPDLSPSNYYLFRSMQDALADKQFSSYEEVQNWVDKWIASKDIAFYRRGIALLPERWEKLIQNEGNYFD